ncbi:hypothetical protein [Tateyamaria sp. SN3-11]|uniref:hypothetical protein n=1 Tax=Tateyamaria sp. SN3-11 TaxID=3092147 RepID=UPI0039E752DF
MTKTKSLTLTDLRPALLTGALLIAVLALSACAERRADRIAFDGVFFRSTASKVEKDRSEFEIGVSPVSASLEGAREAGRYEATRYCIDNFGTSDINWVEGPDAEDGTLRISGDKLVLRGACIDI